jgi:hypothetical protein
MSNLRRYQVLDPDESYTFSRYFELPFSREEILADLDCTLDRQSLTLPTYTQELGFLPGLSRDIDQNLNLVDPVSETARREAIVAPILLSVCRHLQVKLKIEYTIKVNNWLKGSLDYYLQGPNSLLIIEAKQSDLAKGFVQLATELIALDQWITSSAPTLYGAVTTGDVWRFGALSREGGGANRLLMVEDSNLYQVPKDLEVLVRFLAGIAGYDATRRA